MEPEMIGTLVTTLLALVQSWRLHKAKKELAAKVTDILPSKKRGGKK